jgi:hypothetical protein
MMDGSPIHARLEAFPVGTRDERGPERENDGRSAISPPPHKHAVPAELGVAPSTFRIFPDLNSVSALSSNLRLHAAPSLFFGAAVCAIFLLLSAFLEYYVADSTAGHFGLFAAGSCAPDSREAACPPL